MNNWPEVPLGEVLTEAKPGFASGQDLAEGVFQFRMNNLTRDGRLDLSKRRRVSRGMSKLDAYLLTPGDVLFNATNSPELVGKTAYIDELDEPAVFSNHFVRLRTKPERMDGRYLARALQFQWDRGLFRLRAKRWVNQATFGREALLGMTVAVPPVEEQRRIAAILDVADALQAKRRASRALLDDLTDSIFLEKFGHVAPVPVSLATSAQGLPEGWAWEPLVNVATLATGHTPDRAEPSYWRGDIPWISLTEIRALDGCVAEDTKLRVTQAGIDNSSSVVLPQGTVCFSRTASIGFVTVMGHQMATSQDFVNWVCGERLHPIYLMYAFMRSREQLRSISTGSTHKTIYMRVAEKFHVLVPPRELQDELAKQARRVAEQKVRLTRSASEFDMLFTAMRHLAFRGDL